MTDTDHHLARTDFEQFVEQVAENNRKRDGSPPEYVATHVIVGTTILEDNVTGDPVHALQFNAQPYFDGERVWPKDVLEGVDSDIYYPYDAHPDASLREIAVEMLSCEIYRYYDEHGWEQNGDSTVQRE